VLVKRGLSGNSRGRVLSEPGKQYAVYFFGGESAKPLLAIPTGKYHAEWLSPVTGKVLKSEAITAKEIPVELSSPKFNPDIVLRIKRIEVK
jgi:hypothetical protein